MLYGYAKSVSYERGRNQERLQANILKFREASELFSASYETKKIWLNNDLCNLIEKIKLQIDETINNIEPFASSDFHHSQTPAFDTAIVSAWEELTGAIKIIKTEIEQKFKSLMHV